MAHGRLGLSEPAFFRVLAWVSNRTLAEEQKLNALLSFGSKLLAVGTFFTCCRTYFRSFSLVKSSTGESYESGDCQEL
jgi:hypothetical protein